jgi:hypothetical protein
LGVVEFAGEQRVVADYDTGIGGHERAGGVAAFGLSGVALKPPVKRVVPGLELRGVVARGVVALGG